MKFDEVMVTLDSLNQLHEKMEQDLRDAGVCPTILYCDVCSWAQEIKPGDVAFFLGHGWPIHCNETMRTNGKMPSGVVLREDKPLVPAQLRTLPVEEV